MTDTPASPNDTEPTSAERLAAERDEALERYRRALADFQNYQRRAVQNEQSARQQAVKSVVLSIIPLLEHFELALAQNPEAVSAQQMIAGVRAIRDEFARVLGTHGVGEVRPAPGSEFNPAVHEAVVQRAEPGVPPGRIVATLRTGYTLGDIVVRPAQVAVAPTGA